MLLRKWRSNSKQLNLLWQQEGVKTESSETSAIDLRPPTKVLGLAWDPEYDLIYFDSKDLLKFMSRRGESKRFILSVVGRIFDPIGILGPFVIKLKCLLQELWTLGPPNGDSELPQSYDTSGSSGVAEVEGLTEIKIPRFYLEKSKQNLDLEEKNVDVKTTSSNSVFHNRDGVLLQCVKAGIIGRSSSDKIFCLFDNGSSDFYWSLTHRIKRLDSSLVAVETRLGWSLQGRYDERSDCTSVHLVHSEDESISTELRRFWEIESLGILDKGSMTLGNGDEEILSEFDKSVNFVDGRYRVNLPWKPGMREALQNNKTVARKRFEGWEGIVERTSCDSLLDSQGFYLPHHAVIRSDKTTSHIRIVFDGSAHEDGQSSLNQSLYTGPNLHPNILELLLCFRKSPVAFTADVKSAFLQIELDFRDRDFTRFFWTDNLNKEPYGFEFHESSFLDFDLAHTFSQQL
ncbi:integrase catalytic domain-containing protein [Trichonephila clavipes]|nr:integrase catalytic domain-containing protein [Trichonephila clavipes]